MRARRRLKTQVCASCSLIFTGDRCSRCPRTVDKPWFDDFIATRACKDAKCANCSAVFSVDRGDGKKLLVFPNGAGGTALYVVCKDCAARAQKMGLEDGIPEVARDSKLTVLMSPYNPANHSAFRSVH
jgi:hypothetical protein